MTISKLYSTIKNVPMCVIQECVANATNVPIEHILMTNHSPGARERSIVEARHISMTLSMRFNKISLQNVGKAHGNRDHATVLHAIRTVNDLIDSKDITMYDNFNRSIELVRIWNSKRKDVPKEPTIKDLIRKKVYLSRQLNQIDNQINRKLLNNTKRNPSIVKGWIINRVPLYIRQDLLFKLINK